MELKCEYRYETRNNVQSYICVVTEASITEPDMEIVGFVGEHRPGKNNKGVTAIDFVSLTLQYFPRGLTKIFPNLKALTIDKCGLKEINCNDLTGLENLEILTLSSNQLQWLPSDLLIGMLELKRISFVGNKLECLSSKLLKPIVGNRLEFVSFQTNVKITTFFGPELSGSLKNLQELMNSIDKTCGKPDEDDHFDEVFAKQEFDRDFTANFTQLWSSKRYADFTITAVGKEEEMKEFKVHKNVLGAQSSVMFAAFQNDMKEKKTGKMFIEDFTAETVKGMLKFMYTGEVQESNAMDLFAIAAKYDVTGLKFVTEKLILSNIDSSNAVEVFGLAHLYNSKKMKRAAFGEIKEMFPRKILDDSLLEKPEMLKKLIGAAKKLREAQEEVDNLLLAE